MNLPLLVNFNSMSSLRFETSPPARGLMPVIHTRSLWSTKMPCSVSGQSNPWPGPPHAWTNLPFWSNSITAGAALARCSLGVVRGRWRTHTWSCRSTATHVGTPMTQLFGNCGGHDGSSSYCGTRLPPFCADTADPRPNPPAAAPTSNRTARMLRMLRLMSPPEELLTPQVPVQHLFGKFDAFEIEDLRVLFRPPHERHADFPRSCEHLRVLD